MWLLTLGIAATTGALFLLGVTPLDAIDAPIRLPWYGLALAFYVGEVAIVHLHFRREAHSFSLSEIALVVGLFFAAPVDVVLAQFVGGFLALVVHRRQSALKAAFNLSHFCLEACMGVIVFHFIVGQSDILGQGAWLAALVATAITASIGVLLTVVAISLAEGDGTLHSLRYLLGFGIGVGITNTSLALIGVELMRTNLTAAWLLIVPVALFFFAYRAYTSERQKHEGLQLLYESTRFAQQSLQVESVMLALLSQARKMFRAEMADIDFFPAEEGEQARRTVLGPGDQQEVMRPVELNPDEGVWARVAAEGEGIVLPRPITNPKLREYFAGRGMRDVMVAPLRDGSEIVGVMHVANRLGDVTTFDQEDLKLFETLVNHASVSITNARLVDRLKESLAHLTEMNQLKDDFVAAVTHELRTPLTSIQGYIKTMLRPEADFSPEQQHSFLKAVERQGDRLHNLIEDLLAASRLESRDDGLAITQVDMAEVAERVAESLSTRLSDHALRLRVDPALPKVRTDEHKVHQILCNLVENAVKYSPGGTTITIEGRSDDDWVVLKVIDEGPGIPPDEREKIFDRFYQIDQSSTRSVGGTGLGLYICRRFAEAIGGELSLERSDERGSTFSLKLAAIPARPLPRRLAATRVDALSDEGRPRLGALALEAPQQFPS